MKESFKNSIKRYYDAEAKLRNSKTGRKEWKIRIREKFYNLLRQYNKKTLLDLGAGAGHDSLFFKNNDLLVTAIDISPEMVKCCLEKGIEAYEMDFYNLRFLNKRFDCIYAMNSLFHIPKADLTNILEEIDSVLNEEGLFYIGVWGGEDIEQEIMGDEICNEPRFYAFHSEEYLKSLLEERFRIIDFETIQVNLGVVDVFYSITMIKSK